MHLNNKTFDLICNAWTIYSLWSDLNTVLDSIYTAQSNLWNVLAINFYRYLNMPLSFIKV